MFTIFDLQGASDVARAIDPSTKELAYNPKFEELFAPVQGPENPFLTEQMRAPRNTLSGYVEKAHISAFNFENQRRTFHTYGFALDPSVNGEVADGSSYVGDLATAYDTDGKTVFESPKPKKKRKQEKNDDPADIEGFLGPWGRYENEKTVAKPSEEEKAALEELLAKRHRRNRIPEDKPLEEKSILHSKSNCTSNCVVSVLTVRCSLFQLKIHWIIKVDHFCTLHTILVSICEQTLHPIDAFCQNLTYIRGPDTRKAFQRFVSFRKQLTYCCHRVWTAV